jgi:hypothetical protein
MSISKVRTILYGSAKILGDISAIIKGKVLQRIGRRIAGKITGRLIFTRLFKKSR